MRAALLLVLLAAVAAAPAAAAKAAVTLEAHDSYFLRPDTEERNPDLVVAAGEGLVVTLVQAGVQAHDWVVDGVDGARTALVDGAGERATASFVAPAAGRFEYHCEVHPAAMRGTFRIAEAGEAPNVTAGEETPGLGFGALVLVGVVAALVCRRR